MSSTCFEPKGSSSGRRLYVQVWYNLFTCQRYKQSCRRKSAHLLVYIMRLYYNTRRSQWPRGLRRRSAAARLLRSWVLIPQGAWIFVCCECCVLSGRCLCDELITRLEKSYRIWCVVVCDLETSRMRSYDPRWRAAPQKKMQYMVQKT